MNSIFVVLADLLIFTGLSIGFYTGNVSSGHFWIVVCLLLGVIELQKINIAGGK